MHSTRLVEYISGILFIFMENDISVFVFLIIIVLSRNVTAVQIGVLVFCAFCIWGNSAEFFQSCNDKSENLGSELLYSVLNHSVMTPGE